jgi:NTP pyrophosphatase (non-canonical NTP hydrolase)
MNEKEREVLLITSEECSEVTQAISKCFRFGMDQVKPGKPKTNREHLAEELGDLQAMIRLCIELNIVDTQDIETAAVNKITKLHTWSNIFKEKINEQN